MVIVLLDIVAITAVDSVKLSNLVSRDVNPFTTAKPIVFAGKDTVPDDTVKPFEAVNNPEFL